MSKSGVNPNGYGHRKPLAGGKSGLIELMGMPARYQTDRQAVSSQHHQPVDTGIDLLSQEAHHHGRGDIGPSITLEISQNRQAGEIRLLAHSMKDEESTS